jgi:uncharacterized protein (UPF0333 family)
MRFKFNEKGQGALEFLILIGIVIFFLTIFFVAINQNMGDNQKEKRNLAIEDIAISVQDEINLASKSSDGYSREFKVPYNIEGKDYNITIVDDLVYVKTLDDKEALSLPIMEISGQIIKGNNLIKKENGSVYLNL